MKEELSLDEAVRLFELPEAILRNAVNKHRVAHRIVDGMIHVSTSDVRKLKDEKERLRPILQEMYDIHAAFDEKDDVPRR